MQQKEIKYTGITAIPSDYDSQDGDLSVLINMTNEDGNILSVSPPKTLFVLQPNQKVIFVHKTPSFCNYITHDIALNKLCYFSNSPLTTTELMTIEGTELFHVNAIGNTLLLLTSNGMYYLLYKRNSYENLGTKPPFLNLSFGLQGAVIESDYYHINSDKLELNPPISNTITLNGEAKNQITEQVTAAINKYIKEKSIGRGEFIFPFFVRYSYRAFDGSYMQSPPVLMIPNSGRCPVIDIMSYTYSDNVARGFNARIRSYIGGLTYRLLNSVEELTQLRKWEDVIQNIDIYISEPIYSYDQNGSCQAIVKGRYDDEISQYQSLGFGYMDIGKTAINRRFFYSRVDWSNDLINPQVIGPYFDEKDIHRRIKETSNFYKVATIKVKELIEEGKIVINPNKLAALQTQERLVEEYNSHDTIIPSYSFVYNSRLNIANLHRKLFGFPSESLFIYTNGLIENGVATPRSFTYLIHIFLLENGKELLVHNSSKLPIYEAPEYLFYPNPNATRAIIERTSSTGEKSYAEVKMEKHQFLNGAFYFSEYNGIVFKTTFDTSVLNATEPIIYHPNKIYTSEVNNPFQFPATGINSVGSGTIIGISSSTKALSQGQFGQFPLYAFTDEGVWALEVSPAGSYSAKQPATRDVCNNPTSITQLDGAVVFTTDQGIMLLSGAESKCISDILDGAIFKQSLLVSFPILIEKAELNDIPFEYIPFKEFLMGCQMVYDYPNSRIILFNPKQEYSYVYNLKNKTWSIIVSNFSNAINAYPLSYAMTTKNTLVDITKSNESLKTKGVIITRPLKLDAPDLLKTVTQSIHRGVFEEGKIKTVLYGSRDCINFVPIASSNSHAIRSVHGSPYKYFRYVIVADLSPRESISGTSIIFDTKQTNKLR